MGFRKLVLGFVILFLAYVVGGNIYLRVRVEKDLQVALSQWETRMNARALPEQRVRVRVSRISPSFTLLPFFSPSQSFVVTGVKVTASNGELSVSRLVGSAAVSPGGIKKLKLTALEGLDVRGKDGAMEFSVKKLVFTPPLDLGWITGMARETRKKVGGKGEDIYLSALDKKGGEMEVRLKGISFKEVVDMGKKGELPPQAPFRVSSMLRALEITYKAPGEGMEAFMDFVKMDGGLVRDQDSYTYTLREKVDTELSRLKLTTPPGKKKINPGVLLPVKGNLELELSGMSEELVTAFLDLMRTYQKTPLDDRQRMAVMLQFLGRALPPLMSSHLKARAGLSFPGHSGISCKFSSRIMEILKARRSGNPLWITVRVKKKDQLLDLFSRAGIKDKGMEEFFSGFVCRGEVCEKKIPLGRGRHKS